MRHHDIQMPGQFKATSDPQAPSSLDEATALLEVERKQHAATQRRLAEAVIVAEAAGLSLGTGEQLSERAAALMAESRHLHMTGDECAKAGIAKVVLAKDGWYVPPVLRAS